MVDITVLLQKAPCPTSLLKRIDKYWGSKSQNLSLQRRHRSDTPSLSREARESHGKAAHPKSRKAISDKQMGNTTLKVLGWSQSGPTPGKVQVTSYCTKSWSDHWRCAKFPHQQPAGWWRPYFSGPSHQKRVERWQGQSRRNLVDQDSLAGSTRFLGNMGRHSQQVSSLGRPVEGPTNQAQPSSLGNLWHCDTTKL